MTDNSILDDLSTPFVEVAKQVGASDTTVHARNKHLLNSGINNKFIISVNNNGLNRDMSSDSDEILEMHGRFDLLLKLRARNLEQMRDILVNSVRKCSRVVELKLMSMLKTPRKNKPGERP